MCDKRTAVGTFSSRSIRIGMTTLVEQVDPDSGATLSIWLNMTLAARHAGVGVSTLCKAIKGGHQSAGYFWRAVDEDDLDDDRLALVPVQPGPIAQGISAATGGLTSPEEAFEALRGMRPLDFLAQVPSSPVARGEPLSAIFDRVSEGVRRCLAWECDHHNAGLACARYFVDDPEEKAELYERHKARYASSSSPQRRVVQCDVMSGEPITTWSSPMEFLESIGKRGKSAGPITITANHNAALAAEGRPMSRWTAQGYRWRWFDAPHKDACEPTETK